MMKFRRPSFAFLKSTRFTVIFVSSIVGLAIIAYLILSFLAWRGINHYTETATSELKTSIVKNLGTGNAEIVAQDGVKKILTDFKKKYHTDSCAVSQMYAWQTFIPAVLDIKTACEQRIVVNNGALDALTILDTFYKDQAGAKEVFMSAIEQTKTTTDYKAASEIWRATLMSPKLGMVTGAFAPVALKMINASTELRSAYNNLNVANVDEDKAGFDKQAAKIEEIYGTLGEIQPLAERQLQDITSAFITAYEKL